MFRISFTDYSGAEILKLYKENDKMTKEEIISNMHNVVNGCDSME